MYVRRHPEFFVYIKQAHGVTGATWAIIMGMGMAIHINTLYDVHAIRQIMFKHICMMFMHACDVHAICQIMFKHICIMITHI